MASRNDVIGNEADETSPLLGREEWQPATRSSPASQDQLKEPIRIALVLCLGKFLWIVASGYSMFPWLQLAEDAACKRYHLHHPHANATQPDNGFRDPFLPACGVDTQLRVMHWFRLQAVIMAVVGVLVAYPFGVLADKIGRRPVYALAAAGQSASVLWSMIVFAGWKVLPVELVLVAPVFQLLGGGSLVGPAVLYAMLSDIMPVQKRTMWFFFLAASAMAGALIWSTTATELATRGTPWVPLVISLILGLVNASLMLGVPETLKVDPTEEELLAERITIAEAREAFVHRTAFREHVSDAWTSLSTIVDSRSIALILLIFMIISATQQQIMRLYFFALFNRFHLDPFRSQVYLVPLISNLVRLLLLAVVFPLLTQYLTPSHYGVSYFRRDLLLARVSAIFIPIGFLLLGMPNLAVAITGFAVYTLSVGFSPLLQSIVTHYVESAKTARLFALISAMMVVVNFAIEPFFSWLSNMQLEGFWDGLPSLILAVLGLVAVSAVGLVRSEVFVEVLPRDGNEGDAQLWDEESML